jgi:replicative DNA helicase
MAQVPNNNPEAEQSVLGAILVRPEVLDEVLELIRADDFYRTAHALIFKAMQELHNRQEPVDLVTVTVKLTEWSKLEEVGGPTFLAALSEQVGFATNAPYYAKLVWQKSQIRKIRAKATQILNQNPDGDLEEYATWAESQIFEVTQPALNRVNSFPPLDGTETPVSEYLKNPPPPPR